MSRNNHPFQVLVPTGDQAILAKDQNISDLAVGQLGVFSYKDNVSLDSTSTDLLTRGKNFYLAVGVDPDGGSTLGDINKSAGTHVQLRNVVAYSGACYSPAQEKIVEVEGFTTKCDTEYGVKFEIRNQQAYRVHGFNQVVKSFVAKSPDCEGCETCPTGDCISVVKDLVTDINADADGLITAEFIGYVGSVTVDTEPTADATATITVGAEGPTNVSVLDADTTTQVATKIAAAINGVTDTIYSATSSGAVVTIYGPAAAAVDFDPTTTGATSTDVAIAKSVVADADVFEAGAPSGTCLGMRFTVQPDTLKSFCDINLNYFAPRQTDILTSLIGFDASISPTTTQDISYESGSGYDVRQMEYEAGGWNARPGTYRVSNLNGVAREGFNYFASTSGKYNVFHLEYDQASIAGFLEHKNNLRTVIAIPTADTTARDGIVAVLDAILAGSFEPLAAFATACPSDGTTVNNLITSGESFGDSMGTI